VFTIPECLQNSIKWSLPVKHNFLLLYLLYIKYNNKKACFTGKDHFIEWSKYPTTFCGTFLHLLMFSHLLQKLSSFAVQDCKWATSWCRTQTLPKCTLILKCHVFLWYTHEYNFFTSIRETRSCSGLISMKIINTRRYYARNFTQFYPHL
jgi:hypothetical protein